LAGVLVVEQDAGRTRRQLLGEQDHGGDAFTVPCHQGSTAMRHAREYLSVLDIELQKTVDRLLQPEKATYRRTVHRSPSFDDARVHPTARPEPDAHPGPKHHDECWR
jgi:hypothetical protein